MIPSHFIASHRPDGCTGYTWTLPSRLGAMLAEVEDLYGPRDYTTTILGVEFGPNPVPNIWYPGDRKHVIVQLSLSAREDVAKACYQLAHECIHLLSPCGAKKAPYIEEGLATIYAEDYVMKNFHTKILPGHEKYSLASHLVRRLLSYDPLSVKKIRSIEPSFTKLTQEIILQVLPGFDPSIAALLVEEFY